MKTQLTIVSPCFNEEGAIETLVQRIQKCMENAGLSFELILVNDGSTDKTWDIISQISSKYSFVVGVNSPINKGIHSAWTLGVEQASSKLVCLIDADLQNLPEDIPRLHTTLLNSYVDFVQANRSEIDRRDQTRYLMSRILNFLLNTLFRDNAKDNKSGFLIGPKFALLATLKAMPKVKHPQTFIRVTARSLGYSFTEVETLFAERHSGKSFLAGAKSWKVSLESLSDLIRARIKIQSGRGKPKDPTLLPGIDISTRLKPTYTGWRRLLFEMYFATMPLHKWLITSNARHIYLQLKAAEYLTKEEIQLLQENKLNRLLHSAQAKVPYYRKKFQELRLDSKISSLEELFRYPLLNKEDVRQNLYFDMFSLEHKKKEMHKITTSGSTGQPFTTYADRYQLEVRFASTLRALEWTGWRFGDKQARLWHQTLGMSTTQVIRERIDSLFMRRLFIPAFEINPTNLHKFVRKIKRHGPVLVDGYAESLNFLASFINSGATANFSPKAMMSSAQALPDNVRNVIEKGFRTRVFDKYGSREFSGIAYQCEKSENHHIVAESYIVELMVEGRPALPGEVGEVIVTDLNNYSVPLIRFRVGDLAEAVDETVPCPCGRSQPRIGKIYGRSQAIVICADKTWMPGTFFAHFFKDYDSTIRLFQVYQKVEGSFELRIVKGISWNESDFETIIMRLKEYVGVDTKIDVIYVEEIPLLKTGKRSPVVSDVPYDFQSVKSETIRKGLRT